MTRAPMAALAVAGGLPEARATFWSAIHADGHLQLLV